MRQRFTNNQKHTSRRNVLLSVAIFLVIFFGFQMAVATVSRQTAAEEMQTLENAIQRDITQCYAVEGSYPSSLQYLKDNYGLHYDESRYFVDYQPLGSNILPEVTIIQKGGIKP